MENDTPGRNPGDKVGDKEWSCKLVQKRKTKGKKAVPAADSEKTRKRSQTPRPREPSWKWFWVTTQSLEKRRSKICCRSRKSKTREQTMLKKLLETMGEDDTIKDFRDAMKKQLGESDKVAIQGDVKHCKYRGESFMH